jgi:phage tail sheath protein FI
MSYTYPGVYIEELQSPVHAIAGVATSIAAFVGYTPRGIDNRAQAIFSFGDFERLYGGLAADSELSYAVSHFFQNGGTQAYVVRVPRDAASAANVVFNGLTFTALSSGKWPNGELLIDSDVANLDLAADAKAFNLTITNLLDGTVESFPAVTLDKTARNYVLTVVNDPDNGSQLVKVSDAGGAAADFPLSGLVGTELTVAAVNNAIGGSNTATKPTADFGVTVTTSKPDPKAPFPIPVKVFAKDGGIPQSVAGLAAQLQQALSAALALKVPAASVVCSVSPPIGAPGKDAIRVNVMLPDIPDAVISIGAPGVAGLSDASGALGLSGGSANVAHYTMGTGNNWASQSSSGKGSDGNSLPTDNELIGDPLQFTGLSALLKVDLFNLLSIPDATRASPMNSTTQDSKVDPVAVYSAAIALCRQRRAFLLVDPPPYVASVAGAIDWITDKLGITDANGAAFFPRVRLPDPLNQGKLRTFAPSGVVAGVYATTDAARGVWKAPAGIQATLNGVQSMTYPLSDPENGQLNPLGLNCLRTFPVYGRVLWGARTLAGADAMASQWKYIPVRRMALFLEESLFRGTKWVVFEPNDEPLWASIRLNITSFMQTYFLKGAFQGQTPTEAYFVKCDSETTTQTDIDNGVVNILVGFAPLQPAEFVVIQIEQLTGQV